MFYTAIMKKKINSLILSHRNHCGGVLRKDSNKQS